MMSEFDKDGNAAFANGFEKLATFDKDNNGIIEGAELKGLMFWVDDGDAVTEAGELQPLSKFGITQIMVPTNKNTLQGDYTKKDRDTLTLSGGQYQEPLPEVQDYPTDQIVPPVLENTPGREFVLGGEVQLESHTEYDIWHPGDKKQVDINVNKVHQHINDAKAKKIADDIFNKVIPVVNNTADVDEKVIERDMLQELNTHREHLEIDPLPVDVTLLRIHVEEQLHAPHVLRTV